MRCEGLPPLGSLSLLTRQVRRERRIAQDIWVEEPGRLQEALWEPDAAQLLSVWAMLRSAAPGWQNPRISPHSTTPPELDSAQGCTR